MQQHNYSLTEIENLMPWELDIYTILLENHLKEEKQRHEEQTRKMKR
jgi:hypothetical protein